MIEEPAAKKEDEIFCPECGKPIKKNAVICVHCGVQVKELASQSKELSTVTHKSKTTAVVLAGFFSFWSWLYTYKKNINKFLIAILAILVFLLSVRLFKIEATNILTYLYFLLSGIWMWAIVDNVIKPNSFYENYPNDKVSYNNKLKELEERIALCIQPGILSYFAQYFHF